MSEAWFAGLIGVPFVAVVPATTSPAKLREIERYGGRCHLVGSAAELDPAAVRLARTTGGHYVHQFRDAERATDWRRSDLAESLFDQLSSER